MYQVSGRLEEPIDACAPAHLLDTRTVTALVAILVLATAVRFGMVANAPAFILVQNTPDFFGAGYSLAQGEEMSLPLKRPPGYVFFLSGAIATVGPNLDRIAVIQHLLGLGTVVLIYFVGAMAFGRVVGLVAALGTAINGSLLLMEHTIGSEALYTPLLITSVLLLLVSLRSGRLSLFLMTGLALGFAALARPITQAAVPLALAVVALQPRAWRFRLFAATVVCMGYLLSTGPWLARNQIIHGTAAISGGLGDSLFARTNRQDRAFDFVDLAERGPDRQRNRVRNRIFELARRNSSGSIVRNRIRAEFGLTEAQSDAALRDAALQVIQQEPEYYVRSTLGMFLTLSLHFANSLDPLWESRANRRYITAWPESIRFALEPFAPRSAAERGAVDRLTIFYQDRKQGTLIGALFLLGAAASLADGRRRGLMFLPLLVMSQLLLYVAINGYQAGDGLLVRYRHPLQPLITLLVVAGAAVLLSQLRTHASCMLLSAAKAAGRLKQSRRGGSAAPPEQVAVE